MLTLFSADLVALSFEVTLVADNLEVVVLTAPISFLAANVLLGLGLISPLVIGFFSVDFGVKEVLGLGVAAVAGEAAGLALAGTVVLDAFANLKYK